MHEFKYLLMRPLKAIIFMPIPNNIQTFKIHILLNVLLINTS